MGILCPSTIGGDGAADVAAKVAPLARMLAPGPPDQVGIASMIKHYTVQSGLLAAMGNSGALAGFGAEQVLDGSSGQPRPRGGTQTFRSTCYDAVVIGAGFFGIETALELKRIGFRQILLAEREAGIMRRASYVNQARVHNGYHYPRSLATAERSRANFEAFVMDYADAVMPGMESIYAIARGSRVNGAQFETFCRMLSVRCDAAPRKVTDLFDRALIESAFVTRELTFNANQLATRLEAELAAAGIELRLRAEARILGGDPDGVDVTVGGAAHRAAYVFNCTYADIEFAGVRLQTSIKKELAEMVLIAPPRELRNRGVTVMDGPFFSCMPFPAAGLHSLSHVRHTPHESYDAVTRRMLAAVRSNRMAIMRDSQRYMPCLSRAQVVGSVFDVKAILIRNEHDDGRPILIERSKAVPRILSILGAKIDNIYEVREFLRAQDWSVVD
jgi:glycine/D-amino acid oxidase-like deaminating enzyme